MEDFDLSDNLPVAYLSLSFYVLVPDDPENPVFGPPNKPERRKKRKRKLKAGSGLDKDEIRAKKKLKKLKKSKRDGEGKGEKKKKKKKKVTAESTEDNADKSGSKKIKAFERKNIRYFTLYNILGFI